MKKILAALAVVLGVFATLTVVSTPAQAVNRCITHAHWNQLRTTWTQYRTHDTLDSTGLLVARERSGYNDRKLDTWRDYTSCGYSGDSIEINFDDYTAPGTVYYGGYLRVYDGYWEHYCLDSAPLYDDWTGDEIGYTCYDAGWQEDVYYGDDTFDRRAGRTAARTTAPSPETVPVTDSFGKSSK